MVCVRVSLEVHKELLQKGETVALQLLFFFSFCQLAQ